jgi:hypothetical protein
VSYRGAELTGASQRRSDSNEIDAGAKDCQAMSDRPPAELSASKAPWLSLIRTAIKIVGWVRLIGYTLMAGLRVTREVAPDAIDDGPPGESVAHQLREDWRSRTLADQLFIQGMFISIGVGLVIATRRKDGSH